VRIVDSEPGPGDRVGYRLRISNGTGEAAGGLVWINVTRTPRFELTLLPREAPHADLRYAISQREPGTVRLDVLDVRGRVRMRQADGGTAGSTHQVALRGSATLAAWHLLDPGTLGR